MKVLILSPYPQEIIKILEKNQDNYLIYNEKLKISFLKKNRIYYFLWVQVFNYKRYYRYF